MLSNGLLPSSSALSMPPFFFKVLRLFCSGGGNSRLTDKLSILPP